MTPLTGPEAPATLVTARATTRRVARTFALACRLLPRGLRDDVYLLYLVFRTLDDLVDDGSAPEATLRVAAVRAWCDAEPADSPETRILAELDARHALPRHALRDFCAGMEFDLAGDAIRTEADLDAYCYRVAGTVGVVMASILGTSDPDVGERTAAALGMAMQRTNVLRDIDEDAANGRVYVARESVVALGGSIEPGRREALMRNGIERADALYAEGAVGIGLLRHGRRAVSAAAAMYQEILRQIERDGYGRAGGRAVVAQPRKLAIAARRGARPL